MNTCSFCAKKIDDDQLAVARVLGRTERETPISCRFEYQEILWLDHWECHINHERRSFWRKLWDLLRGN